MDPRIIVAVITVVGGWIFYVLQKIVDKRYSKAKEVVANNSATIVDMVNVVKGMKILVDQYRAQINDLEKHNKELEAENDRLKGETGDAGTNDSTR